MPIARFQMPDGRIARFEVPEGTTPEEAQALMEQAVASGAAAPARPSAAKSGFRPAVAAGWENLKGAAAGFAGRTGLMSIADAEAQQARNKAAAETAFTPTQDTWLDSPWLKVKEVAGGSLPWLVAPVVAGAAGAAAAPTLPVVALGAAGLVSGVQHAASNLGAQQDTGKKLADTDLAAASAAAVPQALLDVVGFKMIPGIRRIFQAAGKELTPQAAATIAKNGLKGVMADYAKAGIKASGVEGITEAGQKVFERLQAGLALNDEAAREAYMQDFIGGAVLGGGLSVPGRFHERGREQMRIAELDAAKEAKAEADAAALAQQQEQQKAQQRQDPAYAAQVADRYKKAEATYRSMLPGKLGADADQADKAEHAAQQKAADEFLKNELQPLIPEYLAIKPTLKAQQDAAFAAAGKKGAEPTPQEEAGLLFPLEPTTMAPPGPGVPTAAEVAAERTKLAEQQQALDVHIESLRDQAAKAAQAGDTQESLRLAKQFTQAQEAAGKIRTQIEQLPKAPKNVDLAKQLENAKKALAKAGETGDVEAIARAAAKIEKLKASGAELMQPGPEMDMVPAGGKSESAPDFFGRVATNDLSGADTPQLPYNPARAAFEGATRRDKDFPQVQQQFDTNRRTEAQEKGTGQEIAKMAANRLDTTETAQGDLFQEPEAKVKVQQGTGAVSAKSRAQLVADLQIARAARNKAAVAEAVDGLRDLKAREEAEVAAAKDPASSALTDAGRVASAVARTRMPEKVAKQQAAADARHRAYGAMVSILNRFNKGLAKKDELDRARQQLLSNLIDDIDASRDTPLTDAEATAVRKQAEPLLNDLQSRFGDTRDIANFGTKKEPDFNPVQYGDGTFTKRKVDRPLGTTNVESQGPGSRTFGSPMAAAKSIQEGLEQIRADAIGGTGTVVGKPTPRETTPEALNEALTHAETSPLLERVKANLPAFAADPARRALAADWLHKQSIGLDNELGGKVTAELDRLEEGKRSETDAGRTAVQEDMFPDAERQGTIFATKEEFDDYLAGDALQALRAADGKTTETMSRVMRQLAPLEQRITSLQTSLAKVQARGAGAAARKDADAAAAAARFSAAEKKLQDLIRDTIVTRLEPVQAEAEVARQELAQAHQAIADIEASIAENHYAFYGQFSDEKYVAAAMDTLAKAREKQIALINEPNAVENIKNNVWLSEPVVKATQRVNDALIDAIQALQREPSSRQVIAFLNKDLDLQIKLHGTESTPGAVQRLAQAQANLQEVLQRLNVTAPKTIEGNVRRSPQGAELQAEMTAAKKQEAAVAARNKKLQAMSKVIVQISDDLDAATQELADALKPALARAKDRTRPGDAPGPSSEIDAVQRAENARLERMANAPGELITFTDMQLVADKFAALPERVAVLEEKAADAELPATTRAKAKDQANRARWKMENLRGLLADDVATNAQAREAAAAQMEKVKDKIGKKRISLNEDGISDSTQRSRAKDLRRLQTELRDLQRFVAEFDQKVTRTPKETPAQRAQRLEGDRFVENPTELSQDMQDEAAALEATAADENASPGARRAAAQQAKLIRAGRLAATKRGPVVKKTVVAGNIRTGDATTAGERRVSPRNPIAQAGALRPVTSKQAQRGAAKDVEYEQAMLRMSKLETKLEQTETRLEEATDPDVIEKLTQFQDRIEKAIRATQKIIDGTATGKRKVKAERDVFIDDYVDEEAETATMFLPNMRTPLRLTEKEQVRKFGAVVNKDAASPEPKKAAAQETPAAPAPAAVSQPVTKPRLKQVDDQTPQEGMDARERWIEQKYGATFDKTSPIHGLTYTDAARWGAQQTNSPLTKQLFLRLAEMLDGVSTKNGAGRVYAVGKPGFDEKGFPITGHYHPTFDYVLTPAKRAGRPQYVSTLLHELMHAATSRGLKTDAALNRIVTSLRERVIEWTQGAVGKAHLNKTYLLKHKMRDGTYNIYGLTNNEEFMAELYSNRQFQNMLAAIPSEIPVQSVLTRFVNAIARFFKMPTAAQRSLLAEALMVSEDVMSATKAQRESGVRYKPTDDEVDNAPPSPYAIGNAIAKDKTFKERYADNLALSAEMWGVDMRAPLEQALAKGDKQAARQTMYFVRKNDARMDQVNSVFSYGALGLRKDAKGNHVVEAGNSKSVNDVFKAIQKIPGRDAAEKMEKAQVYLTALRAQADPTAEFALQLGKLTPEQIAADLAKLTADPKQKAALEEVRRVYADLNRGLIKFLEETGALSKAQSALYMKSDSYVPFYRVRKDGVAELVFDETKIVRLGDIRTQPYLKQLEGGDEKLMPLAQSITRNVMLLTDMGMRNLTTRNVAYALQAIGKPAGKMAIHKGEGPANVRALRFKQDGEEYHSVVDTEGTVAEGIPSEMVARSVEGSFTVLPAFLKAFGWFGDVLRGGVTRNPMYVGRQLFRDPLAASFTGGLERGPITAIAKAMADFTHQSAGGPTKTAETMLRKGIVNSGIFTGDPDDLSKMSMQLAGNDTSAIRKLFNMADRAAMRADAVTRQQLYDDVLRRTGSEMEAELAAREMMNFHKRGMAPTVQYASRLIPFFNAQIQGLNVLYKAATGKATMQEKLAIKQKFYDRAGLLMASTFLYALAMEDDDTYKNARASMRYGHWFVPLHRDDTDPSKDVTIKLPIPFEIGLIFKAVPEALIDHMRGQSTEQEWQAIRNMFLNQIPGGSSYMIPQAVKPLIEVATNHSFFMGREIEGPGMQGVDPMERYTARTTELAKRMSEMLQSDVTPDFLKLSPVQIEHLARGYLGTLPIIGAALVNEMFGTATKETPERKLSETPLFGAIFQDRFGGGATDILYAKIKAANQVQATVKKMENEGRKQDAKMYLQNVENLGSIPQLQNAEKRLQELSKKERAVRASESATPERKREILNQIALQRERISRRYLDAVSAVAQ